MEILFFDSLWAASCFSGGKKYYLLVKCDGSKKEISVQIGLLIKLLV